MGSRLNAIAFGGAIEVLENHPNDLLNAICKPEAILSLNNKQKYRVILSQDNLVEYYKINAVSGVELARLFKSFIEEKPNNPDINMLLKYIIESVELMAAMGAISLIRKYKIHPQSFSIPKNENWISALVNLGFSDELFLAAFFYREHSSELAPKRKRGKQKHLTAAQEFEKLAPFYKVALIKLNKNPSKAELIRMFNKYDILSDNSSLRQKTGEDIEDTVIRVSNAITPSKSSR